MPPPPADIRLLATWHQRRRELTERIEALLLHGPTAVVRVRSRAEELRGAYAEELAALEAFLALAPGRPGDEPGTPHDDAGGKPVTDRRPPLRPVPGSGSDDDRPVLVLAPRPPD